MSSTNKTTNYELSQFLGTDKPAWLSDYNTDMSKIDTQMKLNADAATTANGGVTTNATNIGTLANLTTDAKTNVVAAINEVDSHADAAQSTASSALSTAGGASNDVAALTNYLSLSSITKYTNASQYQIQQGGGTVSSADITVARNSAGTLGKIYGAIVINNVSTTSGTSNVKLNVDTGLRPSSTLTVNGCGINQLDANGTIKLVTNLSIIINTDGTIEFSGYRPEGGTMYFRPLGCLIFVEDFGDQPE